ncbi:hypothetical protein CRG98_004409 [Punica granatum]|uniref:Aminotransferase-like plant mobile domain-containing protein n=1 Tax=Punica granatum TaxID=22663 RepID=A0A2I0L398_PUNGR|nr:hypothetical protein CRG98_004409 [Punica granatum]
MVSGDSFSHASVALPREGGHSQAALYRRTHACPDEMKFECVQLGDSAGDILSGFRLNSVCLLVRMDRSAPSLGLESFMPPGREIMRIWRTLCPVDRAVIRSIIGDLVALVECPVDWIFLRTAVEFWDPQHVVFNFQGTELSPIVEEYTALIQRPTPIAQGILMPNPFALIRSQFSALLGLITWLLEFTHVHALHAEAESYQLGACHVFLLLIFDTLLFPYSPTLIDGAVVQVILQAIRGHSYVEALLTETIRSLDYIRCPGVIGVPHLSHLGSTLIFPSRVVRQLDGLQDIPTEADRLPFRLQWADFSSMASARFLQIREIRRVWDTHVLQDLYFPEHPTDEERALSATAAYVAQFYALDSMPERRAQTIPIPRAPLTVVSEAESSAQGAIRAELQSIREERDQLRCELVDFRVELVDYKNLQRDQDREIARLSALLDQMRAKARRSPALRFGSRRPLFAPLKPTCRSLSYQARRNVGFMFMFL